MKDKETDYLDKLFASSSDATDEAEVDFPLLEVPDGLGDKLRVIAERAAPENVVVIKRGIFESWPKITSIAASLFIAIMGLQFYQQQQTLKQLEKAQTDLATALHYLGEANRITRAQVINSLNDNMNKARLERALDLELKTEIRDRTL